MTSSVFVHPALAFLALAVALPFIRGEYNSWRWILLLPPLIAIWSIFTVAPGMYGTVTYLGEPLILGRVDRLSIVFAQVFAIMALIGMVYGLHVKDKMTHIAALLYVGGSFGCVFAGDYLTVFLFWELMSIGSTFLVWSARNPISTRAGFRYFMYHTVGGLFLLAGLLLRYKAIGTFEFVHVIPEKAMYYDWLILVGFCVNAAVVPLHAWLPDAYPEASVTGAVFMCAFTTKTAVYVLARGFYGFEALAVAGTIMCVYGVLYACIENNARRILSYHIVSQVGYMVAGIGIGTAMTINGAVAHAYAHILYKGLLFMGAGCLLYACGTAKLDKLGGLVGRLPWVMILYMVGALSISGMPVFNGFISKTMTIAGAAHAHRTWLAVGMEVAAVGTFLSVGIKLPYFAFWSKAPNTTMELKPIPWNMYAGMAMAALLCLAQGLCPQILYHYLPVEMEHPYHPWAPWNVLQAGMLLGFSGLAFYFMRTVLTPHAKTNLDFDFFYRWIGRGVLALVCKPIAWIDDRWTEAYRAGGLRGLLGVATGTVWFDKKGIDLVLDGSAYTVRNIGKVGAKLQTGRLQDYLAWAAVLAVCVFALVWYFA